MSPQDDKWEQALERSRGLKETFGPNAYDRALETGAKALFKVAASPLTLGLKLGKGLSSFVNKATDYCTGVEEYKADADEPIGPQPRL